MDKYNDSLGCETFDVLGFKSEEELNQEISRLIEVRSELKSKPKIHSIY